MQHANDHHGLVQDLVVDRVGALKRDAQASAQLLACRPKLGMLAKGFEPPLQREQDAAGDRLRSFDR